tara:strand:+ start:12421 stop:13866 length:1446 start_codon:yes stop_codon:yes gene_type:complete
MAKEIDYGKIGLKCGLEIHQQLDTKKLFCNCPSLLRQDNPDIEIKRKLHAVAGESGEIDTAASYEFSKNKDFIYQGYDTTCLIELDESPPREINKESLKIALQISLLLNAKIFTTTQIMRKTVIDGSNTSGFQRTVLIAKDGFVETSYGKVMIETICLEEDSARIISRDNENMVYRLDRLGIPLIEIATAPDIKNPVQAKEVALHLGNILRSFKVKRGIGTIRQDVNVSIRNGKRVEIKGVQNLDLIKKSVEKEAERQYGLVNNKKTFDSEVRKILPDGKTEFLRPMPGAARMYPETDLPLLKISRKIIDESKKEIPKLRHEIEEEFKKKGLNHEMIKILFKKNKIDEFKELLKILNNPNLIAKILLIYPKEISSRENISFTKTEEILNFDVFDFIIRNLKNEKISESQVKHVLERILKGEELEKAIIFGKESENIIEEKITKIIKSKPGLSLKAYMGLIMKEFRGKISGKEVMDIIKKYI